MAAKPVCFKDLCSARPIATESRRQRQDQFWEKAVWFAVAVCALQSGIGIADPAVHQAVRGTLFTGSGYGWQTVAAARSESGDTAGSGPQNSGSSDYDDDADWQRHRIVERLDLRDSPQCDCSSGSIFA